MTENTASSATDSQHPVPFVFNVDHGGFFKLYLKTLLLTVITFGIYSFWARVAITRYLYRHTSFGEQSFDYHATGKELFIGFLKGVGIVLGAVLAIGIILKILPMLNLPVMIGLYIGGVLFLAPFIVLGKWRFLLSRSSYCNVRFRCDGDYKEFRGVWIKGVLLTIVTLGFYFPIFQNSLQKFLTDHSKFGTHEFCYTGNGREYFFLWLKGVLLSIVTLGVYSFWYATSLNRYIFSHTTLNGRKFGSTMTGGGLFLTAIGNLFIVLFTLTLGFPVAVNRMYRYFFSNLTLEASPDDIATAAAGMDTGASAFASGLEEAANVADAVSGIF